MLESFTRTLHLGLSRTGITLVERHGLLRRRSRMLVERPVPAKAWLADAALSDELHGVLAATDGRRTPLTVVLADELVRLMMVEPPHNAQRLRDCAAAAALRFRTLYDDVPGGWEIAAHWDARHPFLASAVPRPLLAALRAVALQQRLTLVRIQPHFVAAANRWHRVLASGSWLAVAHGTHLTVGVLGVSGITAIRMLSIRPDIWDDHTLEQLIAQETLRLDVPAPALLQLTGSIPVTWERKRLGDTTCVRLAAGQLPAAPSVPAAGVALALAGVRT